SGIPLEIEKLRTNMISITTLFRWDRIDDSSRAPVIEFSAWSRHLVPRPK
ncbi:hypothetical protein P3X46_034508, partial [Hevea brasiliensis]